MQACPEVEIDSLPLRHDRSGANRRGMTSEEGSATFVAVTDAGRNQRSTGCSIWNPIFSYSGLP